MEFASEEGKTRQTNFRRMLLTKCQKEFEKDKKDDENLETMLKDIEKAETVSGERSGGQGENNRCVLKDTMLVTLVFVKDMVLNDV